MRMPSLEELTKDFEELQQLHDQASRPRVKDALSLDIRKIQSEIVRQKELIESENDSGAADAKAVPVKPKPPVRCTKDITTYAWDQSEKFMKIYITLNGVQNLSKENITLDVRERSFRLKVDNMDNTNYVCHVAFLWGDVVPGSSYHKVKTDMVLVMLKKSQTPTWPHVTQQEAASKDKKVPKADDGGDPSGNLMGMLQNMYEGGDDDMKRTIAKAWTESRNK